MSHMIGGTGCSVGSLTLLSDALLQVPVPNILDHSSAWKFGMSLTLVTTAVNQLSNTAFHCAVMFPVSKFRTDGALPACFSDIPTHTP